MVTLPSQRILPEGNHAVAALEGARVVCGRRAESGVDVDFVEVAHGALVLLQMALGTEADGARVAAEGPLEVVDVDVKPQLGGLGEDLLADPAHGLTLLVYLKDFLKSFKTVC
jgi:hypothetical protein